MRDNLRIDRRIQSEIVETRRTGRELVLPVEIEETQRNIGESVSDRIGGEYLILVIVGVQ